MIKKKKKCRAKNISIQLPCCIKLVFHIILHVMAYCFIKHLTPIVNFYFIWQSDIFVLCYHSLTLSVIHTIEVNGRMVVGGELSPNLTL